MELLSIFIISAFTLTLEFLQTRIFSVVYWYHLVYLIITLALLGISVGGLVFYLFPRIKLMETKRLYGFCQIGFGCSALFGTIIASRLPIDFFLFNKFLINNLIRLFISYLLALIPYTFFGLHIVFAFSKSYKKAGVIYFYNLLGSAVGPLLYILGIKLLGAPNFLFLIFLVSFIFGSFLIRNKKILLFCLLLFLGIEVARLPILPERNKQFWTYFKERIIEFSKWDYIAKIDVVSEGNVNIKDDNNSIKKIKTEKIILIDGDAQSRLINADIHNRNTVIDYHKELPYLLNMIRGRTPCDNVLVIGSGGGSEVITAYKNGAANIDAVEINSTIVEICKNRFANFINNIFNLPNVNLNCEDGRSYIERVKKKYDTIVIFAVDSLSALNSGAYILSENYLYTKEAFNSYWNHLSPKGILQVSRWYFPLYPRETFRVFTTIYEILKQNKIKEPFKHILIVSSSAFADVLISPTTYTTEEIQKLKYYLDKSNYRLIFPSGGEDSEGENQFMEFAKAASIGKEAEYIDNYLFDIRPVSDDSPFFFQYGRWSHIYKSYPIVNNYYDSIVGRWPFLILFLLISFSIISVILFLWIPFLLKRCKEANFLENFPVVFYFSLIALGFIFMEITLIQKFILVLGHPIYSMAVVIPGILLFSGLGSLFYEIMRNNYKIFWTSLIILSFMSIFSLQTIYGGNLYSLFEHSLIDRILIIILILAPLAFIMGIPFPAGIYKLIKTDTELSLAWIANGGFSVIGSIASIIFAMQMGFKVVLVLSLSAYLIASIVVLTFYKKVKRLSFKI